MLTTLLPAIALARWALAQDEPFASAPFQKPVSLRERLLPVSDLCERLSKDLGVSLRADKGVGDLKLALRVRERPAKWTLEKAAEVLDLEWKRVDGGYVLQAAPETAPALREARRQAEIRTRGAQRKALDVLAVAAAKSLGELEAERASLAAERERLLRERPAGWSDKVAGLVGRLRGLESAATEPAYALGSLVRANPAAQSRLLEEGEIVVASTERLPGVLSFAAPYLRDLAAARASAWLVAGHLRGEVVTFFVRLDERGTSTYGDRLLVAPTADAPFTLSRYASWGMAAESIAKALPEKPLTESSPRGWPAHPIIADVLLDAAERSEIDLVADAFRLPPELAPSGGSTPRDLFRSLIGGKQGPFLRVVDGAVLYRHAQFWNRRDSEIPERTLATLNRVPSTDRMALFNAGAEFARRLSVEQVQRFAIRYEGYGANVEGARYALPALRFWGTLAPAQRSAALERSPIKLSELGPASRASYLRAVAEYLLLGGDGQGENDVRLLLAAAGAPGEAPAFLAETTVVPYTLVQATSRAFPIPLERAPEGSAQDGVLRRNVFYFGFDAARAIRYSMILAEPKPGD